MVLEPAALPRDLFILLTEEFSHIDLVRLSSCNHTYRQLLVPTIFKSLVFTNRARSCESALLVATRYGAHVLAIHFTGCTLQEDERRSLVRDLAAKVNKKVSGLRGGSLALPIAATRLLSGELTPNLEAVKMLFDYTFFEIRADMGELDDDYDRTVAYETSHIRLALMREAWAALACCDSVRKLEIDELIPWRVSVFATKPWREFIGRLTELHVTMYTDIISAEVESTFPSKYLHFVWSLTDWLFVHSTSLLKLKFQPSSFKPLGLAGRDKRLWQEPYTPLPLIADHMPRLRELELHNCFVEPELVDFCAAHSKSLKLLTLTECFAGYNHDSYGVSWWQFLDGLRNAQVGLRLLNMSNMVVPLKFRDSDVLYNPMKHDNRKRKEVKRLLACNKSLRRFCYLVLNDWYMLPSEDDDLDLESVQEGKDQLAFDRLQGMIATNIKSASAPASA